MGTPNFHFANIDDPCYEPPCSDMYTKKQIAILNGDVGLENIRADELIKLKRKAFRLQDIDALELATELYYAKTNPECYWPNMSIEEAQEILQRLTPWDITSKQSDK